MNDKKLVEYTFDIKGRVTITLEGRDTDANYELAKKMALEKAAVELDEDWIDDVNAEAYTDYEDIQIEEKLYA